MTFYIISIEDKVPNICLITYLLVYSYSIEPGVHNVDPAVPGAEYKQRHERLAQVVEVVLSVHPHVALYREAV